MKIIARTILISRLNLGYQGKAAINDLKATIVFESEYRNPDALRGWKNFSYMAYMGIFRVARDKWSPTVKYPRLGGNTKIRSI